MSGLTDLQAAVTAQNSVIASTTTLLSGLVSQLQAALASGDSDAAVESLAQELQANTATLAAAVSANTPAAPAPAPASAPVSSKGSA
jgi:hypothetical protein